MVQTKLLKIIQDQNFEKQGKTIKLDIRFVAATAKDLKKEILIGNFRQDLFYRLNVIPLHIPDLTERKEDISMLVMHFIQQLVKSSGLKQREFSPEAIATLQAYNWPGNIRELRNVVEWAMIMNPFVSEDEKIIKPDMLPQNITNYSAGMIGNTENLIDIMSLPLREAREIFEKQYLTAQMNRFNNNISKTSAFVGMERSALHRKLKLLNIHSSKFKLDQDELDSDHSLLLN